MADDPTGSVASAGSFSAEQVVKCQSETSKWIPVANMVSGQT